MAKIETAVWSDGGDAGALGGRVGGNIGTDTLSATSAKFHWYQLILRKIAVKTRE